MAESQRRITSSSSAVSGLASGSSRCSTSPQDANLPTRCQPFEVGTLSSCWHLVASCVVGLLGRYQRHTAPRPPNVRVGRRVYPRRFGKTSTTSTMCGLLSGALRMPQTPPRPTCRRQFRRSPPGEVVPRIRIPLAPVNHFGNRRRVGFTDQRQPCADYRFLAGGQGCRRLPDGRGKGFRLRRTRPTGQHLGTGRIGKAAHLHGGAVGVVNPPPAGSRRARPDFWQGCGFLFLGLDFLGNPRRGGYKTYETRFCSFRSVAAWGFFVFQPCQPVHRAPPFSSLG